ncbi:hypothetical protein BKA70DRAFT_1448340 [Coprinopsis sp. MPI-PUGE-AT-0042]|nr:hypothetical protein BKA70DRAFT_1448340 [Coprinopsis sp. MPI-PUGE-AT-0042]
MGWMSLGPLLLVTRTRLSSPPAQVNQPTPHQSTSAQAKPTNEKLELCPTPFRNSMAQRRQGKRGTVRSRNIIQGSKGFTINGGTYVNGDAPTTTQYNFLVINVNGSPSLAVSVSHAAAFSFSSRSIMT